MSDLRNQITVLQWPAEAYIGEYMTVIINTGSKDFWAQLSQRLRDQGELELATWCEHRSYELLIIKERHNGMSAVSWWSASTPDENNIVSWYVRIPPTATWWDGSPIEPGAYQFQVSLDGPPMGRHIAIMGESWMVERYIIIKEPVLSEAPPEAPPEVSPPAPPEAPPVSEPPPTQSLPRQPQGNPEAMKAYITPNDPQVQEAVEDILSGY